MYMNVRPNVNFFKGVRKFYELQTGLSRCYHPEVLSVPDVPLSFHQPDTHILTSEDSSLLRGLLPDVKEITYETTRLKGIELINKFYRKSSTIIYKFWVGSNRIYYRMLEKDVLLITGSALRTAKNTRTKYFKQNYFITDIGGILTIEKLFFAPIGKFGYNLKEASSKLANVPDKLSLDVAKEKWAEVMQKLPMWQSTLARKLQAFQDYVNKRVVEKIDVSKDKDKK